MAFSSTFAPLLWLAIVRLERLKFWVKPCRMNSKFWHCCSCSSFRDPKLISCFISTIFMVLFLKSKSRKYLNACYLKMHPLRIMILRFSLECRDLKIAAAVRVLSPPEHSSSSMVLFSFKTVNKLEEDCVLTAKFSKMSFLTD